MDQPRQENISHPVFWPSNLELPVVYRQQVMISRRGLLADAYRLAEETPTDVSIINFCADRYNFLVVFVACLIRNAPSILPHEKRPQSIAKVLGLYPNGRVLTDHAVGVDPSDVQLVDFHGRNAGASLDNPLIPATQVAATVFSSGSTGEPTPTHRTWQWLVTGGSDYVNGLDLDQLVGCSIVATVPSQHSYGLEAACMLPLRHAAAVSSSHPFYPADIAAALSTLSPPRVLVTTPHHLDVLQRSTVTLPKLDLAVSATAAMSNEFARSIQRRLECRLVEVYGCTEVGLIGTREPDTTDSWTLGKSLSMSIRDEAAQVSAEHLPKPVFLDDVLLCADDGDFRLTGRRRDIVKVGGNRVSLDGMNAILRRIAGVEDGVIFQIGDAFDGNAGRVAGLVVLRGRNLEAVQRELRVQLPAAFWPRPLRRVDAIPRGSTGKARMSDLIELLERSNVTK